MADKGSSGDDLIKLMVTAGLVGGGQTHEQIQYSRETQVWVQLYQAAGLVLAICAVVGGLWLMGGGLVWVLQQAEGAGDLLMVSIPGAVVMTGVRGVAIRLRRRIAETDGATAGDESKGRRVAVVAGIVEAITTVLALLSVFSIIQVVADDRWEMWDGVRVVLGLGLTVAGSLVTWRFANELFNPLFPKSPTTEILERLVAAMEEQDGAQVVEVQGPFPARVNGGPAVPTLPMPGLPAQQGQVEVRLSENYKLFVDLCALVRRAQDYGLTREANVDSVKPRLTLPSGERLTRGRLQQLWEYGVRWSLWNYDAQKGQTPEWGIEPSAALKLLEQAWSLNQQGPGTLPKASRAGK